MGQRCVQICFKDLGACCFGSQWQTEWRWPQTAHFHDVQLKRRPFPFPITALTCLEICPCKFLRVTHDLHWYLEKEQQQQPCAFKCCEILANPFLGFSEPFQFRCGASSALLASAFWKIFGFMAISTPFFFFFPTRTNPVFYRPRKHCNFLTPIVFWHQQEGQIPLAFSQLTKSQGCILHILLPSKNSCKSIPELRFLPRLRSSSSLVSYFTSLLVAGNPLICYEGR